MTEGAPLLRVYRLIPYRGFESLSLRHLLKVKILKVKKIKNIQSRLILASAFLVAKKLYFIEIISEFIG